MISTKNCALIIMMIKKIYKNLITKKHKNKKENELWITLLISE